jgi:hypothetical protein
LQLTALHRFTNPAEAAASLALRDGQATGLGFYRDHRRVHVGDLAQTAEDAFNAWVMDRQDGRDAIMLAPTRELVANLGKWRSLTVRIHAQMTLKIRSGHFPS